MLTPRWYLQDSSRGKQKTSRSRTDTGLTGGCLSFRACGSTPQPAENSSLCHPFLGGYILGSKAPSGPQIRANIGSGDRSPVTTVDEDLRPSRAPQQSVSVRLSYLKPVFIVLAPLGHCFNDRAQGLSQTAQGVFHTGRYLRIDSAGKDTILFHRAEAVREHLLANASKSRRSSLKRQGRCIRLRRIRSFRLLPISCTVVATGQAGISSFVSIVLPHFLALTEILHSKILRQHRTT